MSFRRTSIQKQGPRDADLFPHHSTCVNELLCIYAIDGDLVFFTGNVLQAYVRSETVVQHPFHV